MSTREHETQPSPVEPPVIDLDAEEIAAASEPDLGEAAELPPPPKPALQRTLPVRTIAAVALVVVAAAAGALTFRSYGDQFWPGSRTVSLEERLATLEAETKTLANQLSGIGGTVDELKNVGSGLATKVDDLASRSGAADERLNAIDARLAEAETGLKSSRDAIAKLGASGGTGTGVAHPPELDDLTARVAALEAALADRKANPSTATAESPEMAELSQALADLKAKLASGAPFAAEAATIARLVPEARALDRLLPYAKTGLPTAQGLGAEIEALAAGLPGNDKPDTGTVDTGSSWGPIGDFLGSIVTVRTLGEAEWQDVCAKSAADAKAGHLAAAVGRLDDLETELPAPIVEWRDKARARLTADVAIEDVSSAVIRVLTSSPGKS